MTTDWNEKKTHFAGLSISWENKDYYQRLLTIFLSDVVEALNTTLEYGFIMEFVSEQQLFVEKSPYFWSEVINSVEFSSVMKTAKLFDETKNAIGLQKVFNILEQSPYGECLQKELVACREQYSNYTDYILEIKVLRDKVFAHNDKKNYQFWKCPQDNNIEIERLFWGKLEEMLIWVRDSILRIRTLMGDGYPVNREIINDLANMLTI